MRLFIDHVAVAKQGDNGFRDVCLSNWSNCLISACQVQQKSITPKFRVKDGYYQSNKFVCNTVNA